MPRRYAQTKTRLLQEICRDYMKVHGVDSVDPDEVAMWAISTGRWEERPYSAVKRCRRELVDAMRLEHFEDPQGRDVRRMHPVRVLRGENYTFDWCDIYKMSAKKWKASQNLRRDGVLGVLKQMKTDCESWNENNVHGAQLSLFNPDFTEDLAEMDQPDDFWPDEDPESGGEDDGGEDPDAPPSYPFPSA